MLEHDEKSDEDFASYFIVDSLVMIPVGCQRSSWHQCRLLISAHNSRGKEPFLRNLVVFTIRQTHIAVVCSPRLYSSKSTPLQAAASSSSASLSHSSGQDFSDITIVGGGVVGLALATSLSANNSFVSSNAKLNLIEGSSLDRAREWSKVKQDGAKIQEWENRVIYLTEENRKWLDVIGVTSYLLPSRLGPVHRMHVTDGVTNAALNFDTPDSRQHRMGTMVEISNLQQALLRRLQDSSSFKSGRIVICDSTRVEDIIAEEEGAAAFDAWPVLQLSNSSKKLKTRLLIGADGANSPVRKYSGIKVIGWEYGGMGVVATLRFNKDPFDIRTAYQRFLPTGTIAWLPLSSDTASLVWTLPPNMAKAINAMHKNDLQNEKEQVSPLAHLITAAFRLPWPALRKILDKVVAAPQGDDSRWIIKTIEEESRYSNSIPDHIPAPVTKVDKNSVAAFPLKLSHAETYLGSSRLQTTFAESGAASLQPSAILGNLVNIFTSTPTGDESNKIRGRTALIGDAAHTIHPLAGQGLNLGLADAKSLCKTLILALERGEDIGSHISLSSYPRDRYLVNQAMLSAVDHLHWLFLKRPPGDPKIGLMGDLWSRAVVWGRSTGFEVLNEMNTVKRLLTGFAGSRK